MGPKISQLEKKNPKLWNQLLSEPMMIKSFGIESTVPENYTETYDNARIPDEALDSLAQEIVSKGIKL